MKQVRQIPAIALTALAKENITKSLYAGFQRHLTKPIKPAQLVKAITEVIIGMNAITS